VQNPVVLESNQRKLSLRIGSIEGYRETSSNGSQKFEGYSVSIEELCG
jgi:hypothetical protein